MARSFETRLQSSRDPETAASYEGLSVGLTPQTPLTETRLSPRKRMMALECTDDDGMNQPVGFGKEARVIRAAVGEVNDRI